MSTHRHRLLALLLATALPVVPIWAASVGPIKVHSYLGQPLLATLSIALNEEENATMLDCIKVLPASEDFPGPGRLQHEVLLNGLVATVQFRSFEVLREPMIGMTVQIGCSETMLSRTFTLLMDPAPLIESVAPIETGHVTAAPLPEAIATRPPRPAVARQRTAITNIRRPQPVAPTTPAPDVAAAAASGSAQLKIEVASGIASQAADLENELQSLQSQHARLRVEMNQLEERMSTLQLRLDSKPLATAATLPPEPETPPAPVKTRSSTWQWLLGGGVLALALAWAAWFLARRNEEDEDEDWLHQPITQEPLNPQTLVDLPKTRATPAVGGIEVEEDHSEIDQAQCLLSEGQALEAIDLLYDVIEKDDKESRAWLMLFRALSQRDSAQEFAALAQRFKTIPPEAEDWEIVRAIGHELDAENPLYFLSGEKIALAAETPTTPVKGQPVLNFFAPAPTPPAEPKMEEGPRLNIDLPPLPDVPNTDDSALQQISRRNAA